MCTWSWLISSECVHNSFDKDWFGSLVGDFSFAFCLNRFVGFMSINSCKKANLQLTIFDMKNGLLYHHWWLVWHWLSGGMSFLFYWNEKWSLLFKHLFSTSLMEKVTENQCLCWKFAKVNCPSTSVQILFTSCLCNSGSRKEMKRNMNWIWKLHFWIRHLDQ